MPTIIESDDFESGGTGPFGDWYGETASNSTDMAHGGTHSLKIAASGANWAVTTAWPGTYDITSEGQEFVIEGYVRNASTTDTSLGVTAVWYDANSNWLSNDGGTSVSDDAMDWTHFAASAFAPTGVGAAKMQVTFWGNNGGTHYLDDFQIKTV